MINMKNMKKFLIIIVSLLLVTSMTSGCLGKYLDNPRIKDATPEYDESDMYEITEVDVFSIEGINSKQITIFGIKLGGSREKVIELIGEPDINTKFVDSENLEYRERLFLKHIGLLVHLDENVVTRITIKIPFNKFLKGETIIMHDKRDVYEMFGKPDKLEQGSFFTQYSFYEMGLEIFVKGTVMNGFSLVEPKAGRETVYEDKSHLLEKEEVEIETEE